MIRVYVAGPIGNDDAERPERLHRAVAAGEQLLRLGFAPFVPHLWSISGAEAALDYEGWMRYDREFLLACDALLRLPGESPGSDREVAAARELGIPVFYAIDVLLRWREERSGS